MNRENLKKLSDYLLSGELKAGFDMGQYADTNDYRVTECGSVGCAIGHGPYAGIPKQRGEDWFEYVDRVFTYDYDIIEWCFDILWAEVDNTPRGAGLRIKWLLDHGVPENYVEQMKGIDPLCYL